MSKIVINQSGGGFGLSDLAVAEYAKRKGLVLIAREHWWETSDGELWSESEIARDDPDLVDIVETHGTDANGQYCKLKIVEIPDGVEWYIWEYETGAEAVHEQHRVWD